MQIRNIDIVHDLPDDTGILGRHNTLVTAHMLASDLALPLQKGRSIRKIKFGVYDPTKDDEHQPEIFVLFDSTPSFLTRVKADDPNPKNVEKFKTIGEWGIYDEFRSSDTN